jgi:hypothetical protein
MQAALLSCGDLVLIQAIGGYAEVAGGPATDMGTIAPHNFPPAPMPEEYLCCRIGHMKGRL